MACLIRSVWWLLILAMLASIPASAQDAASPAKADAVVVGAPLPLTGQFSGFGLMMKNSLDMALNDINKAGGIKGRPLRLVYSDDKGTSALAKTAIAALVEQAGAVMLVGGFQSDVTYALARLANDRDVPFLICTAATDRITQQRWRNVYRLNPPVSEYTLSLQDLLLKELHPKSMAIVYEDSMFGTDGAANMMSFLQDNGIEIRDLISYSAARAGSTYFRSLLAPLTRDPPDVIHMISYLKDGVILVKAIRSLNIPAQLTGSAAGFTHPEFLEQAGMAADHMLVATLWSSQSPYPGAETYYERYRTRYGNIPDYHGAEAYSALLVAADALQRAESLNPASIRNALDKTYMKTPFGPVKFYAYENFERQNSVRTQVLQINAGQFEIVWPADLATAALTRP